MSLCPYVHRGKRHKGEQPFFLTRARLLKKPTRDASPPLVVACGACVRSHVYAKRRKKKSCTWCFYHTTITYTPSILHLTLTHCNSLIISALRSVRYYQNNLHATYTPLMLPHGTSTGGGYYGIGEQKSLLLRQIVLRPYAVLSTAHVQTDCAAAGWGV